MNAHTPSSATTPFQALLGGHDSMQDDLCELATLADALLADTSNAEAMDDAFSRFLEVGRDVTAHMEAEERGVFPALQASGVSHEMIEHLERDHSTLRSMMRELSQLDPASLRAPRKLAHLIHSFVEFFEWHTQREEELALVFRRRDAHAPRSAPRSPQAGKN